MAGELTVHVAIRHVLDGPRIVRLDRQVLRELVADQDGPYGDVRNVDRLSQVRRWHRLRLADLTRGSRTRLTLEKLQYNVPLKDEDLTLEAIRRQ